MGTEFFQDMLNVISHGDLADAKMIRYPFGIHAFRKTPQDFSLTFAQGKRRGNLGLLLSGTFNLLSNL